MIRIITAMSREVKSNRESALTCSKISAVKGVAFFRSRITRVLSNRPRPQCVHRCVWAAQEWWDSCSKSSEQFPRLRNGPFALRRKFVKRNGGKIRSFHSHGFFPETVSTLPLLVHVSVHQQSRLPSMDRRRDQKKIPPE